MSDPQQSTLEAFRSEKDSFLARNPHSPLSSEQRERFAGLSYFPHNPDLVIHGRLEPASEPGEVQLSTSTGGEQAYKRAGILRFEVDGEPAEVTLYSGGHSDKLFLPFRDATSGKETYGAGRYLEVEYPWEGELLVDFNYAYNPNCAFSEQWSCPLPPQENWLRVPIRAGEMSFADHP
jgi:uncharacterized protein